MKSHHQDNCLVKSCGQQKIYLFWQICATLSKQFSPLHTHSKAPSMKTTRLQVIEIVNTDSTGIPTILEDWISQMWFMWARTH